MRLLRRVHLALGLCVSAPLFAFSLSGLVYVLPGQTGGATFAAIDAARIRVGPAEAISRARAFAGKPLPLTALTLQQKDGTVAYEAVGGLGGRSLTVDAESGAVSDTPDPSPATRFFRQAHFFYFAGALQVPLLAAAAALSCLSVLTGLGLALAGLRRPAPSPPTRAP